MSRDIGGMVCTNCKCTLRDGRTFTFKKPGGDRILCLSCSLYHKPMLKRSFITAVVVGTLLTFLNQGDHLFAGTWKPTMYWKVPLTYCVPFMVATWGALSNSRS